LSESVTQKKFFKILIASFCFQKKVAGNGKLNVGRKLESTQLVCSRVVKEKQHTTRVKSNR